MPNNWLSVLYKRIIQVENKNVGLKVGGAQTYHCPPPIKKVGPEMQLMCTPTDNVIFKNKHEPIFKLKLSFMSTMHIFSGNMFCRWGRLPILSV